jgi:CO/xanthine dehydrogenase FAD-binding subunit
MRAYLPAFDLRAPATLAEVLELLAREPGVWHPFAGGTDLMVLLEAGKLTDKRFISLWHLDDLRGITVDANTVTVGALTTYSEVLRHPLLQTEFPLLCEAARETGGIATQNRGTIGGNIANASPAADTPPALLAYDAEIELISSSGSRAVPYDRFHTGYKKMDLGPNELIRAVRLPRGRRNWIESYRKVGTRRAQAISKVCFAAAADVTDGTIHQIRLAFGSVAPAVIRARNAERALEGRALGGVSVPAVRAALASDIAPIDDMRSTAHYRGEVAGRLLDEFLSETLR